MDENIITVNINGTAYPISCSMKATRSIFRRFGTLDKFYERFARRFITKTVREDENPAAVSGAETAAADTEAADQGNNVSVSTADKEDAEFADDFIFILALFINQPIIKHNHENPKSKKDLISEDYLDIYLDWKDMNPIYLRLLAAFTAGIRRTIEGEDAYDGKKGKNA